MNIWELLQEALQYLRSLENRYTSLHLAPALPGGNIWYSCRNMLTSVQLFSFGIYVGILFAEVQVY